MKLFRAIRSKVKYKNFPLIVLEIDYHLSNSFKCELGRLDGVLNLKTRPFLILARHI